MATDQLGEAVRLLRRSDEKTLSDGDLLERFIARRDEAAFAALVRRHGPMVLGVCRRVLRNDADADDAFQATFLVLVRKATSIVPRALVANWLYGVAQMTARKARATNSRRQAKERQAVPPQPPAAESSLSAEALDRELARLPESYRTAVVLCELQGRTLQEAARQLGCPAGTVASRLSRGRALLAERLKRAGILPCAAALAGALAPAAPAAVPLALLDRTVRAGVVSAGGLVSARVARLTEGVVKAMFLTKLRSTALPLALLACAALGLAAAIGPRAAAPAAAAEPAHQADEKQPAKPLPRPVALRLDAEYLDALDRALVRTLTDRLNRERKPETTRPALEGLAKVLPERAGIAAVLQNAGAADGKAGTLGDAVQDLFADFRRRYLDASQSHQAPKDLAKACQLRIDALAGAYARATGRNLAEHTKALDADLHKALDRVNDYRKSAGLKPLDTSGLAASMARIHAGYLDVNRTAGDKLAFGKDDPADAQIPGRPGDCINGSMMAQSSLIAVASPVDAVEQWLATFHGRCALLRPDLKSLGLAAVTTAGMLPDRSGARLVVAQYTDIPGVVPKERTAVVFPTDGAAEVPLRLTDTRPSLLPAKAERDALGHAKAGYPVTVTFWGSESIAPGSARLEMKKGDNWEEVPAHVFTPEVAALPDTWVLNLGTVCLIAREPLRPKTAYRATVKAVIDGKPWAKSWTFRTAAAEVAPASAPLRYEPGAISNLNNAFRNNVGLLLNSKDAFAVKPDGAYLDALDNAFYRAVLWRCRWQEKNGGLEGWRPLLELAAGFSEKRKEVQELLATVKESKAALPGDALDLVADYAVRYERLSGAEGRFDRLMKFYRAHGGKDLNELRTRVAEMADRAVARMNVYRKRLKLPEVALDERLSRACRLQGVYVDLNRGEGKAAWTFKGAMTPHESVPGLPGYSSAGALAGMTSVIAFSTPEDCVNGWMGSFFHRIPLLHPEAKSVGVGYVLSADQYVKGTGKIALLSVPKPNRKPAEKSVVLYPATGSRGVPRTYGVESPNAVAKPEKFDDRGLALAGFPLTATYFGYDKITKASATLFVKKGDGWEKIPAYVSSPESPAVPFFGDNMQSICAMAKDALRPETDYRVEFRATLDGEEWRGEIAFRTGPAELLHQEK